MSSYRNLPDESRVWVYQSNRELSKSEVIEIRDRAEVFVREWAAHGTLLRASVEVFYNRFVVLFVDEEQAMASGCSIDKSVVFVQELERAYSITLMDRMLLAFKQGDDVKVEKMSDFEVKVDRGEITQDTVVFNNLVATKKDFTSSWEVPLRESWHARMLAG